VALPAPELWKADPLSREPRTDALTKELSALCNSAAVSSRSESCGVWAEMVHSVNVGRSVVQRGVRGFRHGVGRGTRSCVCVTGRCAGPRLRPPGRADPDARDGATARASGPSRERQRRASGGGADAAGPRRLDPMRQPTVQFYRAAASKPEPGAGAKTTARPGQRAGATVAVKPSHPQRLAQLLHTTSYMVPGGCACGQRFLTTHVGQTLEQAARRMTR
jgi:hypothetical protein